MTDRDVKGGLTEGLGDVMAEARRDTAEVAAAMKEEAAALRGGEPWEAGRSARARLAEAGEMIDEIKDSFREASDVVNGRTEDLGAKIAALRGGEPWEAGRTERARLAEAGEMIDEIKDSFRDASDVVNGKAELFHSKLAALRGGEPWEEGRSARARLAEAGEMIDEIKNSFRDASDVVNGKAELFHSKMAELRGGEPWEEGRSARARLDEAGEMVEEIRKLFGDMHEKIRLENEKLQHFLKG